MAVQKIDYEDKIQLQNDENIPDKNKVTDEDMNQIKSKVNNNADELSTAQQNIEDLQEGQGTASSEITSLENRVTTLEKDNTKNKQDIANKVDKVEGKGLSTEDYTTAEKEKLAGLSNYNDTEIKQDIQDLKDDVSDIKSNQTTQNDLLERTQSALINITTEKSSNINVKDSSNLNAKIGVFGISEQETRSGKNKANSSAYNYDTVNYQDLNVNLENNEFTISTDSLKIITEYVKVPIKITENGTYTFGLELKANTSGATAQALIYDSTNKKIIGSIFQNNTNTYVKKTATITIDDTVDKSNINVLLYCEGTVGNAYSYSYKNILVNPGQDDKFEQYGASPSPEYPSNIENVGDNINVFDISKITSGSIVINNNDGTLTIKNNPNTNGYVQQTKKLSELCPDLKVGDIATLGFKTTTKNSSYANSIYVGEAWNNGTYKTITQSMLDFQVGFYGGYNEISLINDIKIEKDTKVTSYSKYKCGSIGITVCNKNFFSVKKWKKIIQSMGYPEFLSDSDNSVEIIEQTKTSIKYNQKNIYCGVSSDYIKIKKGQAFELSFEYENINRLFITQYNEDKERIKELNSTSILGTTKFIAESDGYITIAFSYSDANLQPATIEIKNILLALNEITGSFVEPEQQLITFPLQEGQRLYDGDYLASDGIHHVKKQKEFDGTEAYQTQAQPLDNIFYTAILINDMKQLLRDNLLSSHFKGILSPSNNVGISGSYANYLSFGIEVETIGALPTQTEAEKKKLFKTWLAQQKQAGTPVIVEYELAEETVEAYTEAQQEAYNQLQNAQSYYNVTNVFTDKALLEFKYIADTKTYVDNETNSIKEQLNTINELLSTTATSATLLENLQSDLESEVT